MDVKSKLASNMRNQILKQYKLNETKRELKKKDSKITSVIYYNNDGVLIGYNNGKLKSASSLSAAKAGNLTDTTIKKDGAKLSTVQINNMNKTYRQIWQYEGETYGVKPGKIERIENGGGEIINLSDVKGWSPEYQSILETFDMINNKYENPDVSKDLHYGSLSLWNNTDNFGIGGPFTWNSQIPSKFTSNDWFQLNININKSKRDIYIFLHIYNNEKRDRMKNVFQMSNSIKYNETEKPKRMEIGYYCKDKKEFKTLFNNQSFTNGKHVELVNADYYMTHHGKYDGSISEPITVGKLITKYNVINLLNPTDFWSNHYTARFYKSMKDYFTDGNILSSTRYTIKFIPSLNNNYVGGGIKKYE